MQEVIETGKQKDLLITQYWAVRDYLQKMMIFIRPAMLPEKTERDRWKYLEMKMYKVFKKNKAARVRENRFFLKKEVRAITGQ